MNHCLALLMTKRLRPLTLHELRYILAYLSMALACTNQRNQELREAGPHEHRLRARLHAKWCRGGLAEVPFLHDSWQRARCITACIYSLVTSEVVWANAYSDPEVKRCQAWKRLIVARGAWAAPLQAILTGCGEHLGDAGQD